MFTARSGKSESAGSSRTNSTTSGNQNKADSAKNSLQSCHGSDSKGKLFVVGIGPGGIQGRTHQAENAIKQSDVIFGYTRYIELANDLLEGKEIIPSGMKQEVNRCTAALEKANAGHTVAVLSSGAHRGGVKVMCAPVSIGSALR